MSTENIDNFSSADFEDNIERFAPGTILKNNKEFESSGVKLSSEKKQDYYDYLTKYRFTDSDGKVRDVPVPIRWHPEGVFRRIINHNKLGQYTGIVEIGMSGSGKTTLTRMFLHRVHEMGENYIVKWFTGKDMLNIDKIIQACTVGMPHILIFDDASYTMEDAKKEDVARLANALTTIRHHIKSRVITIMNIHYSKATKKFFRNQHFTFLTSISTEELGNFSDLFKGKMNVIYKFAKVYNDLMLKGRFEIPISSYTYQRLIFKTNEPFRVGLVAEISDLHFVLYAKESCKLCDPAMENLEFKDYHEYLEKLCYKYKERDVRNVLQFFTTIYEGKNCLDPRISVIWRNLAEVQRNVKLPLSEMLETLRARRKKRPDVKGTRGAKKFRDVSVMEVMKKYKEAQDKQKPKKSYDDGETIAPPSDKPKTGDYDSLFVGSTTQRYKE